MPPRTDRRSFLAYVALATLPATLAHATARSRVAIGLPTGTITPDVTEALRAALRDELGRNTAIELVDEPRAAFVLNASVRHEVAASGTGCVVSVLVEERSSRRLRAILEGSARAPSSGEGDVVETGALVRVAVRSALRSLGRAIG